MKPITTFLFVFSFYCCLSQTNPASVKGLIKDSGKKVIPGANIILLRATDSVFVKAGITDESGRFEVENLAFGSYFIKAELLGYDPFKSANFTLNAENPSQNFTEISMAEKPDQLKEVVVTAAPKAFVERKLDKLVVNVENSIVSAGSSVLEVLERSPGVVVNQESSINLKGKSGVIIMIDGKPTPLSGPDLITYLKGIPAANIQSLEIITNPSARYDAAGNAGIINIKYKKDQRQGFNGSVALNYGQGVYAKPSGSINGNYRSKKWNFFASHSHAEPMNLTRFNINRKFFDANGNLESVFDQKTFTKQPVKSDNSRFGADFNISDKTIVGVLFSTNWNRNERNGSTVSVITNPDGSIDFTTDNTILLDEKRFNGFGNLNFKHSFNAAGREIAVDLDYGSYDANTLQDIRNINRDANGQTLTDEMLNTDQKGTITVQSIKADYVHPFSKTAKLELGLKSSWVESDNDAKFFGPPSFAGSTNHFIYQENINALYGSFAREFTKWDFQVGLRMEQTMTEGRQLATAQEFSRDYVNFFPNVVVNRKFSENNSASLSYAKRIDRPSYRQLNPALIYVDPYTYVVGDPQLSPVITDVVEFNHTFKGQYITTLSYTKSRESITDIFVQDDVTRISYQIPANIQDFEQMNLGVYLPFKFRKVVNSTFSGSVFWNKYASPLQGSNLQNEFTSWDARLDNSFALGKGWAAELNGFYQSRSVWGQFIIRSLGQVSTGIQKVSNNKKSTFKFSVSDIFLTNRIAVIVQYQNQDFITNRTWDARVATLSYTYRFGKSTVARARQRNSGVEDEKRRAG